MTNSESTIQDNIMVVTYQFQIPTTVEPGDDFGVFLEHLRKDPSWPLAYLTNIEGKVIPRFSQLKKHNYL